MTRPIDAERMPRWDRETDVVVVGLGCAGAAAAIEARRAGAAVIAFERASAGGGTSANSGGVIYLGGGTPLQTACGFSDSPGEMFKYLMAASGPRPDAAKIRAYCDGSVEHYHWFVDHGVPFKPVYYPHYSGEPPTDDGLVFSGSENAYPFDRIAAPAPRGHVPQIPGQAGGLLMQKLLAAVDASAAEVVADARCETLVVTADGSVAGCALRIDGERRYVRARGGVVLCAGGFVNSKEMLARHAPLLGTCKYRVGTTYDDGSGIRMGAAAGGEPIHMSHGSVSLPIVPPKQLQKGILVNRHGQRFINEDAYLGRLGEHALYHQGGYAFLVLDNTTFTRPEIERDLAGVGDTVAELEAELRLPEGSLQSTVEVYNRHAAIGADPLFHKAPEWLTPLVTPPFGALDCTTARSLYAVFTLGGLHTSPRGEVLDADDQPIAGLYAAGRTTSGIAAPGYASGLSIGDGTFFGRRAGRHAAQRAGR
jgi:succinate dehydrogenase/fumarate reductase flavoprotein subunit